MSEQEFLAKFRSLREKGWKAYLTGKDGSHFRLENRKYPRLGDYDPITAVAREEGLGDFSRAWEESCQAANVLELDTNAEILIRAATSRLGSAGSEHLNNDAYCLRQEFLRAFYMQEDSRFIAKGWNAEDAYQRELAEAATQVDH